MYLRLPLFICCFLLFVWSGSAQVAENITLLGNLDDDTLPTHFYGTYNDVWGYVDAEGREYALMGSASFIHLIDVTDPANPVQIDQIAGGEQTIWRDIKTFGTYAYAVSDGTNEGLMVLDLSDLPNSVTKVAQDNSVFGSMHNIFIDEPNARLYTSTPFHVYDLTDPANPEYLGQGQSSAGYCHDLYVKDNIVYASSGNDGFFIYDFTDVANVQLLASTVTNGYNHSSWLIGDGDYAIFAEEVPTGLPMGIMDLTNLEQGEMEVVLYFKEPLLAPTFEGSTPHNPYVLGDLAIVSYYEDGVLIFDVSDPVDPKRIAFYDTYPDNDDIASPDYGYNGYAGCWGVYPYLPSGNILASDLDYGLFVLQLETPVNTQEEGFDILATLSPNPADEQITIQAEWSEVVDVTLSILDITGKQIQRQKLGWINQVNETLQIDHLPKGMYILNLAGEGVQWNRKWVKP